MAWKMKIMMKLMKLMTGVMLEITTMVLIIIIYIYIISVKS